MFDDYFDDLFSKVWSNFSRPVLDQRPFNYYSCDKGYIIVVNTLGIDKSNLSVTLEKEKGRPYPVLKIKGETNLKKINFKNSVNIGIELKLDTEIKGLSYKCENGLTKILVETATPVAKNNTISGKLVDDDASLDW